MANISHSFVLNYEKFQQFDQHEEETKLWKWKLQIVSWVLFNKKAAAAEIGENYEVQDGGQVNLRWSFQGWCENYDENCDGGDDCVVLRQIAKSLKWSP